MGRALSVHLRPGAVALRSALICPMVNLFYQVGYSGLAIILLALIAIFMAIRGIVLAYLVAKQGFAPHSVLSGIIAKITAQEQNAQDASERELVINTLMQVQLKGIYSSLYFLKLCAAIGPLLGLLGTVLGMIDVFSNLSQRAMPDANMLAGGIWEALLTTVMGLTLAIPALIIHFYLLINLRSFRNKITLILCHHSELVPELTKK